MKKILLLTLIFSSFACFADNDTCGIGGSGGGSKWVDILKCKQLMADFPVIEIQGHRVKFNELCMQGERIRTIYKFPIYENGNTTINKFHFDYLVTDRIIQREVCVRYENDLCVEYGHEEYTIPVTAEINVYKKKEESEMELLFTKEFSLNYCPK